MMWANRAWAGSGARIFFSLLLFGAVLYGCAEVRVECPPQSGVAGGSGEESPSGCGANQPASGQASSNGPPCTTGVVCQFPGNSCGFAGKGRCKNWHTVPNTNSPCFCKCDGG